MAARHSGSRGSVSTHSHEWGMYMDYVLAVYCIAAIVGLTVFFLGLFNGS